MQKAALQTPENGFFRVSGSSLGQQLHSTLCARAVRASVTALSLMARSAFVQHKKGTVR